ncbi:MAG: hypothetical protein H6767_06665 [Candidatus Peribacteria bacterium]|nr:MAG: hypothetical protein H6767_06665 [Candidatus Peribacteria bacterium]
MAKTAAFLAHHAENNFAPSCHNPVTHFEVSGSIIPWRDSSCCQPNQIPRASIPHPAPVTIPRIKSLEMSVSASHTDAYPLSPSTIDATLAPPPIIAHVRTKLYPATVAQTVPKEAQAARAKA